MVVFSSLVSSSAAALTVKVWYVSQFAVVNVKAVGLKLRSVLALLGVTVTDAVPRDLSLTS